MTIAKYSEWIPNSEPFVVHLSINKAPGINDKKKRNLKSIDTASTSQEIQLCISAMSDTRNNHEPFNLTNQDFKCQIKGQ